jgi:putative lipoic acid-binding regulatory protein
MEESKPVLQFPCDFPLKVIGHNTDDFESFVIEIVHHHVPDLDVTIVDTKLSGGGKYLSVSMNFIADSREQMDALYKELSSYERVVWIL